MARLAEASVVIALRDWQWQHRRNSDQFPDRYLALAGKAEKKLGDTVVEHDERLFLFELKSTDKCIKDEWTPVKRKDGSTEPKKSTHRWASALAVSLRGNLEEAEDRQLLIKSLQAHHFVYWSPALMQDVSSSGHLILQPYFLATLRECPEMAWKLLRREWNNAFDLAIAQPQQADTSNGRIRCRIETTLPLDALNNRIGRLTELTHSEDEPIIWHHLGLPYSEFQSYVDALCGGLGEAEPINAVVLSERGSFFAYLTSTDQLKTIFEPSAPDDRVQQKSAESPCTPSTREVIAAPASTYSLQSKPTPQ